MNLSSPVSRPALLSALVFSSSSVPLPARHGVFPAWAQELVVQILQLSLVLMDLAVVLVVEGHAPTAPWCLEPTAPASRGASKKYEGLALA